MRLALRLGLLTFMIAGLGAERAGASFITFERLPDGSTPVDNTRLLAPYAIDGGGTVSFFFDRNNNLTPDQGDAPGWFEQVGNNNPDGFFSQWNSELAGRAIHDRARQGFEAQLGRFFLRQPDGIGPVPAPFVILYDTSQTIRELSGEIWDIDGRASNTEQWRVEVLDAAANVLAVRDSPLGNLGQGPDSLDSLPWTFAFRGLPDGVRAVRLTFIGSKSDGVGLAFNNFSAVSAQGFVIPEPSSLLMAGVGAAGLLGSLRLGRVRARG